MHTKSLPRPLIEYGLSAIVFIFLAVFSYAKFFEIPYIGFDFNPRDGSVIEIFTQDGGSQDLQPGDRLIQVGAVNWETFHQNKRQSLFDRVQPEDTVSLRVVRSGQEISVRWVIPGPNLAEIVDRLNTIWLPYIFWIAGTAILFLVRPKDLRWRLLFSSNYLTALWLATGLVSVGAIWHSAIVMRALIWLSLPVYLHLHWEFPRPLGRLPAPILWGIYLVSAGLAGLEWFQLISPAAYGFGFVLALGGSLALLILHAIIQSDQRRDLRLLAVAAGMIILPTVLIGTVAAGLQDISLWFMWGSLLSLPALPGAYFYVIYRRQFGGLELRANRIITLYVFLILLFILSMIVVFAINVWVNDFGLRIAIEVILVLVAGLAIATTYPSFQRWVESVVLGMPLPPRHLPETYSARITTSLNTESLILLLRDEILPSILVRHSALLWFQEDHFLSPLYRVGVEESQLPTEADTSLLIEQSTKYRSPPTSDQDKDPFEWIRLILPLRVGQDLTGFWFLGRRDPDDWYSQRDIHVLQSIANQTAIALVNIGQAERLRALYRSRIEREEVERARLARGIHDTVLNRLALLATRADDAGASQAWDESYQKMVAYLREVVHNLRPAMLAYGLRAALEELVDDLVERTDEQVDVQLEMAPSELRYDAQVEQHLFRIVQQACENAIQHAQAKTVRIRGQLQDQALWIRVADDGVGFAGDHLTLDQLLMRRHYGLVGMHERAGLIGAQLQIEPAPGAGTRVTVRWEA